MNQVTQPPPVNPSTSGIAEEASILQRHLTVECALRIWQMDSA
jgi:hypothetical protein